MLFAMWQSSCRVTDVSSISVFNECYAITFIALLSSDHVVIM